ncbi:MAG: hypothetical protein M1817_004401 [Caeruleum heppii]|nr:MAG: hypothetical protein M1817_004401 [Caeruleum heppii]
MGFGILEDRSMEHVPGTVFVLDDASRPPNHEISDSRLKYDTTGPVPIILVPQPSDDPNDPLNWPLWKRDVILVILSIMSIMAVALGPILAAITLTLSLYFERDFTDIALLTGYTLAGTGVAGVLFVASARVWGRRHLYLLGSILLVASSAWAGASTSYKSLLWARVFQGVATAPFEALINATVGDMYFVHQRGIRMALTNLSLFGSAFFTPILAGKITQSLGWPWVFYFVAIFSGVALPAVILFTPETAYRRAAHLNTDIFVAEHTEDKVFAPEIDGMRESSSTDTGHHNSAAGTPEKGHTPVAYQKASLATSLLPFNGRKSYRNFFSIFLRPFPLFLHPAILWACVIQGAMIGWTVFIGVVIAAIFLGPPLFFGAVRTGYMYTGAFIGALLGFIVSGFLSDWSAKYLTRHNKGIYEPEFRILLVAPQLVFGCAGLYGFGITSADVLQYGWFWPEFFFALVVMGMVIGTVASALYIVDAYRDVSVEAFTCCLLFKNMFSFGLTWSAYDWIVKSGITRTFTAIASVQVVICLLSIPLYVYGKRSRSFFYRHDLLKMTGLY